MLARFADFAEQQLSLGFEVCKVVGIDGELLRAALRWS